MIGVDTNILLRAVMADDAEQSPRAEAFLSARTRDDPAMINSVVLAEFVWTLREHFELPRAEIVGILRDLVSSEAYEFVDRGAVLEAFHSYENGIGSFTDRLIAEINDRNGCRATATFDGGAMKRPPFISVFEAPR